MDSRRSGVYIGKMNEEAISEFVRLADKPELSQEDKLRLYGEGPWVYEVDHVSFNHAGLPCIIRRVRLGGHFCGYVAVPPGHRLHGCSFEVAARHVRAHGGVNSAVECNVIEGVCHVPAPGEPDDVWWFGFDCAGSRDLSPGDAHLFEGWELTIYREGGKVYRDLAYVKGAVRSLAEQLAGSADG